MKYIKHILGSSAFLLLNACGGSGQDDGTESTYSQSFSGLAIDGFVARATVYLDTNESGVRDPWEDYAFTDNDGYYSYNPKTDTDYCAEDASEEQQQYCLSTNSQKLDLVIRISGGYDVLSGQPFEGQLSRRIADSEQGLDVVISPFTSLLSDLDNEEERASVLSAIGITESDLNVNYLDSDGAGDIDEALLNKALKIHKTISVLNDVLTDTYDELGESYGVPSDASYTVYQNLAQEMLDSSASLEEVITTPSNMVNVLDNAETVVREAYELREIALPADLGDANNTASFDRTTDIVASLPDVVDSVINDDTELTQDQATGASRALEVVIIKALSERGTDTTIDNAIEFLTDESNRDAINVLADALADDTADVNGLASNDFSGSDFDTNEEIRAAARLPEDANPFALLPGTRLRVSDLDFGSAPDQLKDNEVEFYFEGLPSDTEGPFVACVKFIEEGNINTGTISSISTRGEHIEGFWSLLDGDSSYNLLLTIKLFGSTYSGILKPSGSTIIDDVEYQLIRGDADGDFRVWHSEFGQQEIETVPQSDEDCEAQLPSRIGL